MSDSSEGSSKNTATALSTLNISLQEKISRLNDAYTLSVSQKEDADLEIQKLEATNSILVSNITGLKEEIDVLNQNLVSVAQQKHDDIDDYKTEYSKANETLQSQLTESESRARASEELVASLQSKLSASKQMLEECRSEHIENSGSLKLQLEEAERREKEYMESIFQLQQQATAASALASEPTEENESQEIFDLQNQIRVLTETSNFEKEQIEIKNSEITDLADQVRISQIGFFSGVNY